MVTTSSTVRNRGGGRSHSHNDNNSESVVKTTTKHNNKRNNEEDGTKRRDHNRLARYEQLPDWYQEYQANPYILSGYRPVDTYSVKECFLSVFKIHNETVNIWTHLIGVCIFFAIFMLFAVSSVVNHADDDEIYQQQEHDSTTTTYNSVDGDGDSQNTQQWSDFLGGPLIFSASAPDNTSSSSRLNNIVNQTIAKMTQEKQEQEQQQRQAGAAAKKSLQHLKQQRHTTVHSIFIFLASCQIYCFGASVVYHTFHHRSERIYQLTMLCDYVGISIAVTASFVPIIVFAFQCHPIRQMLYMGLISTLGLISIVVPFFPFFDDPKYILVRIAIYVSLVASGVLPTADFIIGIIGIDEAIQEGCPISQMIILTTLLSVMSYVVGVTFYALKIPERWAPGKFDLWCNSHQLWHVFVVVAGVLHAVSCFNLYHRKLIRPCDGI